MIKKKRRRKCLHCGQLYTPDPRTRDRQRHCCAPECKRASKTWRQKRWLQKKSNRGYFSGPDQVQRVQQWRKAHPGYHRRARLSKEALQDDCSPQPSEVQGVAPCLAFDALQDDCWVQPAVIAGLISHLTDVALQDDMVGVLSKFHARGQIILGKGPGIEAKGTQYDPQKNPPPRPPAAASSAVQLGRSPPGA